MPEPPSPNKLRAVSESPDMIEYQPVCRSAVAACVLGIGSALALTGKPFWALPCIAIPMALLALWRMARSEEPLVGRKAAIVGLLAAVLFGTWAVASDRSRQRWVEKMAAEQTLHWFGLVAQGRWEDAHRLTLSPDRRRDPDAPTDDIPAHQAMRNPAQQISAYETFMKQEIVQELQAAGPDIRTEIVKTYGVDSIGASDLISQEVRVAWTKDGQAKSLSLSIVMQRNYDAKQRSADWFLHRIDHKLEK